MSGRRLAAAHGRLDPGRMVPLYRAGRQLVKVRGVMIFSLVTAVLAIWWGIDLAQTYGLNPGDGGVLRPPLQRLGVAAIVTGPGLVFVAGMWVYGTCYAAAIDVDPRRERLHIRTVRFWGTAERIVEVDRVGASRFHHGALHLRISVNAPWVSVRLPDRWLPMIIDAQGTVFDRHLMKTYFGWS